MTEHEPEDTEEIMVLPTNDEIADEDEALVKRRDFLHEVSQPTRHHILIALETHPRGMPSLEEITWMIPDVTNKSTVLSHLETLDEIGAVEKVDLDERTARDLPRTFYQLDDDAHEVLVDAGLLSEDMSYRRNLYAAREDKPDKIQKYEDAPRPGDSPVQLGEIDEDALLTVLKLLKETGDTELAAERLIELERERTELSR